MNKKGAAVLLKKFLALILFSAGQCAFAMYPISINRYDYVMFLPDRWRPCQLELGLLADMGANLKAVNSCGCHTGILKMHSETQDALSMVRGFSPSSDIGQVASILNSVSDYGDVGKIDFCADMRIQEVDFVARYFFNKGLYASLFLPFINADVKNFGFADLTPNITYQDYLVHHFLTNNLKKTVYDLGGVKLQNWKKSGFGDLVLQLGWNKNFLQDRPTLKNVKTSVYGGPTFPTGVQKDQDIPLSFPFGYDGAFGVFLGGTIELTWCDVIVGGVDVRFTHLFGHTKNRRIFTDINQTDLLLLGKACSYVDYGVLQEYFLFLEARRFFRGMTFKFLYNHLDHHDDLITVKDLNFSSNVASSATYLDAWSIHNIILMLCYDWKNECADGARLSLFYKQGVSGKNAILGSFFGAELNVAF